MSFEKHIDDRTIVQLAKGEIKGEDEQYLLKHIINCEECRFKYVNVRKAIYSRRVFPRVPAWIQRMSAVALGVLIFLAMSFFCSRNKPEIVYRVEAAYVSRQEPADSINKPLIRYIYIDTLALNIFYFRGEKTLFRFKFQPEGNVIRIDARRTR